jgi:1-aminocyclopropane-1-carboxylate deaminase/D-cysteine desulfhydrase-like pyridoxal-dependent ACC family enzyme
LLGQAQQENARTIITVGGAGSNHALATALYAKSLGMHAVLILSDQPNASSVRRNLLMDLWIGAQLHCCRNYRAQMRIQKKLVNNIAAREGVPPFVIPAGGSTPIGVLGLVNASFELKEQIDKGIMPRPDIIYCAFGTMATAVGLILGIKAAGLKIRLVAVRVVPSVVGNMAKAKKLFTETNVLLHSIDSSFPLLSLEKNDLVIDNNYFGKQYGLYTNESAAAVRIMKEKENIALEGTYTGKAFAAFLDRARTKKKDEVFLFWNTYNSRKYPQEALDMDFHPLPKPFHKYFTADVQPLDKNI